MRTQELLLMRTQELLLMRTQELLLTATLQLKTQIEGVLPFLDRQAQTDPKFAEFARAYHEIFAGCEKAVRLLMEMKNE